MTGTMRAGRFQQTFLLPVVLALLALTPLVSRAQTAPPSGDLRATIRAELLSDPRTSGLSAVQLNAMVDLLSQQAQKQGMSAHDITWRPQNNETFGSGGGTPGTSNDCNGIPSIACILDEAFGFLGPDATIPFSLGMASMGLIWILAEMIHRHRHPAGMTTLMPTSM